ncbi:MAG: hypothetical protein C4575_05615 [Desulforudis sp.]|nr:MAG: hypothetical protein C4575_05615 [Desulforudis sp.]
MRADRWPNRSTPCRKQGTLPEKKVYVNVRWYGNTSAASIPIAIW